MFLFFLDVEPPPSYESLFGKIKKAKTNSNDNVSFVKSTCGLIMGSSKYINTVAIASNISFILSGTVQTLEGF